MLVGALAIGKVLYDHYSASESVSPAAIKFSQSSICSKFENGTSVNTTILKIAANKLDASSIDKIQVVKRNGQYVR